MIDILDAIRKMYSSVVRTNTKGTQLLAIAGTPWTELFTIDNDTAGIVNEYSVDIEFPTGATYNVRVTRLKTGAPTPLPSYPVDASGGIQERPFPITMTTYLKVEAQVLTGGSDRTVTWRYCSK